MVFGDHLIHSDQICYFSVNSVNTAMLTKRTSKNILLDLQEMVIKLKQVKKMCIN